MNSYAIYRITETLRVLDAALRFKSCWQLGTMRVALVFQPIGSFINHGLRHLRHDALRSAPDVFAASSRKARFAMSHRRSRFRAVTTQSDLTTGRRQVR